MKQLFIKIKINFVLLLFNVDGNYCAIEIKLGLNKAEEGAKHLNKVCDDIVKNGGKAPLLKCVIYGVGNLAYKNKDGVYIFPITALKN